MSPALRPGAGKASLTVGLALLASLLAVATDGAPLRVTAAKGDSHKYRAVAKYEIVGKTLIQTQTVVTKVQSVDSAGLITSLETYTIVASQFDGQPLPGATTQVVTVIRPDGTYASVGAPGANATNSGEEMRLEDLSTIKLPDFALAKGKKWSWDCPADAKTGAVALHAEFKVVGSEKVNGLETWRIEFHSKEADGKPPASSDGEAWLGKLNGLMVRMEAKCEEMPYTGAPGPVSGTQSLELVPGS